MPYSVSDLLGLLLAAALTGPLLLLPAYAIGRWSGFIDARGPRFTFALTLVAACAGLPVLDSLGARLIGLPATLALHLALGAAGLLMLARDGLFSPGRLRSHDRACPSDEQQNAHSSYPRYLLAAVLAWLAVVAFATIDLDWQGSLNQSLLVKDMVKHVATVRSLVEQGAAPPADVFFLRDQPAGYYYFYYTLSALAEVASLGLVDSRAAVAGQIFWTGLAFVALVSILIERARGAAVRPPHGLAVALMAAAGIEIVTVLAIGATAGIWFAQVAWWKEATGAFVHSLLWVPHHVAAVIATWAGLLALAELAGRDAPDRWAPRAALTAFAGAAFASALGLSVWVTLGAVAIAGCWGLLLVWERRWHLLAALSAAGAIALVLSLPQLSDMLGNRAYDGRPIAFAIRAFPFETALGLEGLTKHLARLAWLPVNLALGLGVLLIGAAFYWWRAGWRAAVHTEVARLLVIAAAVGIAVSSFWKSAILNNDLGWRVLLFAQVSALVWSALAIAPLWRLARRRRALLPATMPRIAVATLAALLLGWAGTAYELVALRASDVLGLRALPRYADHQRIDHEARAAYAWASRNLGPGAVLQHNPEQAYFLGFGLYGSLPVAVSQRQLGPLFGASRAAVEWRIASIAPVFDGTIGAVEARARLVRNHVGLVLVTAADPVWNDRTSWVWTSTPVYASERVRVLAVTTLTAQAAGGATPVQ